MFFFHDDKINGFMQEKCDIIMYALELHLSCTNPPGWSWHIVIIMGATLLVTVIIMNKPAMALVMHMQTALFMVTNIKVTSSYNKASQLESFKLQIF